MDKAAAEAFIRRRHAVFLRLLTLRSIIKVLQTELEVTLAEVDDPSIGDDAKEHPEITSRVVEACRHLGIDMELPELNATTTAGPIASTSNTTLDDDAPDDVQGNDNDNDTDSSASSVHWSRKRQIEVLGMTEAEYHSN